MSRLRDLADRVALALMAALVLWGVAVCAGRLWTDLTGGAT